MLRANSAKSSGAKALPRLSIGVPWRDLGEARGRRRAGAAPRTGCRPASARGSAPRWRRCGGAAHRSRRPISRARRAGGRRCRDARSRPPARPARRRPRPRPAPPAGWRGGLGRSQQAARQQAVGRRARRIRHRLAGQHAGDLLAPLALVQRLDHRGRAVAASPAWRRAAAGAPRAATCGLCVTTSTCSRSATRSSRSPTAAAVAPPMPASTSSKTSVGTGEPRESTTFSASISRDSSPPEAIFCSCPGVWPGIGRDQEGDAVHAIGGPAGFLARRHLHHQPGAVELQRRPAPCASAFSSRPAASRRAADSASPAAR